MVHVEEKHSAAENIPKEDGFELTLFFLLLPLLCASISCL